MTGEFTARPGMLSGLLAGLGEAGLVRALTVLGRAALAGCPGRPASARRPGGRSLSTWPFRRSRWRSRRTRLPLSMLSAALSAGPVPHETAGTDRRCDVLTPQSRWPGWARTSCSVLLTGRFRRRRARRPAE